MSLSDTIAIQIEEMIRSGSLPAGGGVSARRLAGVLKVSRTPVASALRDLEKRCLVGRSGSRYVIRDANGVPVPQVTSRSDPIEDAYLKIVEDRLANALPDRVSESEMSRRYGLSRLAVKELMARIFRESWAVRLPGKGWEFLPVLSSLEAYRQSYSFRQAIEPAALLEKSFLVNEGDLRLRLAEQEELVSGGLHRVSAADLIRINSSMHQSVIRCSQNLFFIESLQRVDQLRLLFAMQRPVDTRAAKRRCEEHIVMLNLILAGRREDASEMMRRHLASAGRDRVKGV